MTTEITSVGRNRERLIDFTRKVELEKSKAVKSKKGWRLNVGDLVLQFIKIAPKLIRELVEAMNAKDALIKELEAELAREKTLRLLAEAKLRELEGQQTITITPDTRPYTQPYYVGDPIPDWTYVGNNPQDWHITWSDSSSDVKVS